MTPIHASDATSSFDSDLSLSTDMLPTPGNQSAKETRITRSHNALSGSQIDEMNEFKRGRTKFTPTQIDALEALFVTHGPHPTREQRTLVANEINVYVFVFSTYCRHALLHNDPRFMLCLSLT